MATLEEARKADGEKLNETLNDLMEKVSQRCKKLEIARDVMAKKPGGHPTSSFDPFGFPFFISKPSTLSPLDRPLFDFKTFHAESPLP